MGKRVRTDDRLVGLDRKTSDVRHQTAGGNDLARVDSDVQTKIIATRFHSHYDLFERRIARALPQPIDRALDLSRTTNPDTCQ